MSWYAADATASTATWPLCCAALPHRGTLFVRRYLLTLGQFSRGRCAA